MATKKAKPLKAPAPKDDDPRRLRSSRTIARVPLVQWGRPEAFAYSWKTLFPDGRVRAHTQWSDPAPKGPQQFFNAATAAQHLIADLTCLLKELDAGLDESGKPLVEYVGIKERVEPALRAYASQLQQRDERNLAHRLARLAVRVVDGRIAAERAIELAREQRGDPEWEKGNELDTASRIRGAAASKRGPQASEAKRVARVYCVLAWDSRASVKPAAWDSRLERSGELRTLVEGELMMRDELESRRVPKLNKTSRKKTKA